MNVNDIDVDDQNTFSYTIEDARKVKWSDCLGRCQKSRIILANCKSLGEAKLYCELHSRKKLKILIIDKDIYLIIDDD